MAEDGKSGELLVSVNVDGKDQCTFAPGFIVDDVIIETFSQGGYKLQGCLHL